MRLGGEGGPYQREEGSGKNRERELLRREKAPTKGEFVNHCYRLNNTTDVKCPTLLQLRRSK